MERVANPYASHLEGRDALQIMSGTAGRLEQEYARIGADAAQKPRAPGKWSPREILCHLADCEIAFGFRLRQTLAEEFHIMQPFDQDKWAASYAVYSASDALATFRALRRWNILLIQSASPAALAKRVNHPERGDMTFQTIVETMAGHDIHHLEQLESVGAPPRR